MELMKLFFLINLYVLQKMLTTPQEFHLGGTQTHPGIKRSSFRKSGSIPKSKLTVFISLIKWIHGDTSIMVRVLFPK